MAPLYFMLKLKGVVCFIFKFILSYYAKMKTVYVWDPRVLSVITSRMQRDRKSLWDSLKKLKKKKNEQEMTHLVFDILQEKSVLLL